MPVEAMGGNPSLYAKTYPKSRLRLGLGVET